MPSLAALDNWWTHHVEDLRFDRAPMYVCVIFGSLFVAVSLYLVGPPPGSAVNTLSIDFQKLLAAVLGFGCCVALFGTFAGSKLFFPNLNRQTTYKIGLAAAPAIISSMVVYSWTVMTEVESFTSALGGLIAPAIAFGNMVEASIFFFELRRISHNIPRARKEVLRETTYFRGPTL